MIHDIASTTLLCACACRSTGKERDAESGNDYFGARYYASSMGRFMSPDWAAQEEPVPYAKLSDPQSLNLYGYVGNNPLSKSDPDGHFAAGSGCHQGTTACSQQTPADKKVDKVVKNVEKVVKDHPRTVQAVKGAAKIAAGVATVGLAATAEVGSGGLATAAVVFAVQGGTATAVSGVADVVGAATNTDMSAGQKGLEAVSNPAGLVTSVATGGNLEARARAAAVGDAIMTGATIKDVGEGSPAAVGFKAVQAGQSFSDGAGAVQETMNPKKDNE